MRMGLILLAALTVAGCSGPAESHLVVSAAASLTDSMTELADLYEATNGTEIVLNFGGSTSLREQILAGAAVDVYAPADITNMDSVVAAGMAEDYVVFATNRLEIAVPKGNPADVTGLGDLAKADLFVGLCAIDVPCGSYGMAALSSAGVIPSVDTFEPDVRALLTKVREGELDAGLVYATDVASDEQVDGVAVPEANNILVSYPLASIASSAEIDAATDFIDFVLSAEGRAILTKYGFSTP